MNNKQDKGFTLVELLIVIVILGILATVTVFAVRGITDRGQENACNVEARTIETAAESFYAENPGQIPTMADLNAGYLTEDPSARWTLDGGTATTGARAVPVDDGACDL
jgi:prepilin-type N-terminal cleavage/methylation domain-containing protein